MIANMKRITLIFTSFILSLVVVSAVALADSAASDDLNDICSKKENKGSALCQGYVEGESTDVQNNPQDNPIVSVITDVTNILSLVAGILVVILVMIGGFKYITSGGEAQKAASGRQTIVYALLGMAVVVLSRQLLLFVLGKVL